jgi:hypothetical protein
MKTAYNAAEELIAKLTALGFSEVPQKRQVMLGAFDEIGLRTFNLTNESGYINLRVQIHTDGEPEPQSLSLLKFDGQRSQLLAWKSANMSAHMPLQATLALIESSI